jgi:hypothetical protein
MSTPTAAGIIAPTVGITDPTVAPFPRWQSLMSAMCGQIKGIADVLRACSRVASSQMLAQLNSLGFNLSIKVSDLGVWHASVLLRDAQRGPRFLIQPAVLFHVAVEAQQIAFIQLSPQNFPRAITHLANREFLLCRIAVVEGHRLDAAVIAAADTPSAQVVDASFLS